MSLAAFKLEGSSPSTCVVVGLGLVGNSIAQLLSQHYEKTFQGGVDWASAENCAKDIASLATPNTEQNFELVWAAGKAGFSADEDQLRGEFDFYEKVIKSLFSLFGRRLKVNLISSAGGIYENSDYVTNVDDISPSRAYARAKIEQEQLLCDLNIGYRVYRVSSVYGLGGKRAGLVSSLIEGAIKGSAVRIFAQQNTMRDYIFNLDLARVVVDDVSSGAEQGVYILASGRAVSINMLLNMVARITGTRVRAYYQSDASNENDISFARQVIRRARNTTTLEEGVALMYKQLASVAA